MAWNSCLNFCSWSELKAVLGLLSSLRLEDDDTGAGPPPLPGSFFLTFLTLGPDEGLSLYLVQNTQAGHNWPLGPLTMPGGQSASALGASLEVFERSTGTSTSILGTGLVLVEAVGDELLLLGAGLEAEVLMEAAAEAAAMA